MNEGEGGKGGGKRGEERGNGNRIYEECFYINRSVLVDFVVVVGDYVLFEFEFDFMRHFSYL